ncbi:Inactive poly [ADP-ribose] polymerase SRO2 [Actinidia chinensis var. chinensis]|uniref:Inactive poly [ADP-ribose] polymerase SRO2 n=1 Tax=Actinidia chinensis var. chinensis TaxID=1590841 RepID=A0A2R6P3K5_ACTCC|nr:Inactive poly [ADP-ribose] polymerase SRO2 [Actinidia chinensis var. chinensis]
MDPMGFEDQVSITVEDEEILSLDSEVNSYPSNPEQFEVFAKNGMTIIDEENTEHEVIKKCFLNGMEQFGKNTNVVAIHRNSNSSFTGKARKETFRIFSEAVAKKSGGDANIKYAWYGASRDEICEIMSHGFSRLRKPENGQEPYGLGVHLSPQNFPSDGVSSSVMDQYGFRHVLLCRVILGNTELVRPGSEQFQPSSNEFDSGVDNLSSPRRYIIWSPYMNSHIFPEYIVSFTAPGREVSRTRVVRPNSPYMKFVSLLSMLSNFLPRSRMVLIFKYHSEYQANKISRIQLIRRLRQLAGDKLLTDVIKFYRNKQIEARTR